MCVYLCVPTQRATRLTSLHTWWRSISLRWSLLGGARLSSGRRDVGFRSSSHLKTATPTSHLPPPPDMVSPVSPEMGVTTALWYYVLFPRKDFWWFFQSDDLWDKLKKSEDVLGKGFGPFNSFRFLFKTKVKEFQGNLLKTRLVLGLLSACFSVCKRVSYRGKLNDFFNYIFN